MKLTEEKLAKLVAAVTSFGGPGCFYSRLPREAKTLFDACQKVKETGRTISAGKLSEILAREFQFQASEKTIRRHLNKACTCVKKS